MLDSSLQAANDAVRELPKSFRYDHTTHPCSLLWRLFSTILHLAYEGDSCLAAWLSRGLRPRVKGLGTYKIMTYEGP